MQMELIKQVAERMAKRMNARFVPDPRKVEVFLSHSPSELPDDAEVESTIAEPFDEGRTLAV
jgi:hypothetical protein